MIRQRPCPLHKNVRFPRIFEERVASRQSILLPNCLPGNDTIASLHKLEVGVCKLSRQCDLYTFSKGVKVRLSSVVIRETKDYTRQ